MDISLQNIDKVSALLTVKLEKADYQEKVEKTLKNFRQKAQVPGFRPGMVPMGLVKKMYGKSALAEEVNTILGKAVYDYIRDNDLAVIGEPLPNEDKQPTLDFDTMEEFEFVFDIALAPEIAVTVEATDKVNYYTIEVDEKMIDQQVGFYTQHNGKHEPVDTYADNDMLKGLLAELDEAGNTKEGGVQVEGAVMMPSYMKAEEQKAIFANAKVNDVLVFNPYAAWEGSEAELASLLKIDKKAVASTTSDFSFQIEEITRFVEAPLNQELFDKVYEEGEVTTVEEFRGRIKELLARQFVPSSEYKFLLDFREMIMAKVGKLEFADVLLKRLMVLNNEDKDVAFVEENYENSIKELSWQLVRDMLVKENGVKVEQEDIIAEAKDVTRSQFAQYGMMNIPEDILSKYSLEMLKNEAQTRTMVNRATETKLIAALKSQVTLENKTVTAEEFRKIIE